MADIQHSKGSAAPVAAAASTDSSFDGEERGRGEAPGGDGVTLKEEEESEKEKIKEPDAMNDAEAKTSLAVASETEGSSIGIKDAEGCLNEESKAAVSTVESSTCGQVMDNKSDTDGGNAPIEQSVSQSQPPTQPNSSGTPQQSQHSSSTQHAPSLKRFTSVSITKRFLEKTPSPSGISLGGGSSSAHAPGIGSATSSVQRRGISPNCE